MWGGAVHDLDQLQSEMGTATPWEARGGTARRIAQAVKTPAVGQLGARGGGGEGGTRLELRRPWTPAEPLLPP